VLEDHENFLSHLDKVFVNRGNHGLIKYLKLVKTALIKYLGKDPLPKLDGVRLTSDGIPYSLGDLVETIQLLYHLEIKL